MAASQLTAQPGNAASIAMLDWTNGEGTAWYWVVKMFVDTFGSDTKSVYPTYINGKRSEDAIRVAGNPEVCIHTRLPTHHFHVTMPPFPHALMERRIERTLPYCVEAPA